MKPYHILIVTWWGLKDSLRGAASSLQRLGYSISEYPLARFQWPNSDFCTEDWLWHFHETLQVCDPDIVLWWHLNIPLEPLKLICNHLHANRLHVLYNWDDPYAWRSQELELSEKTRCMHLAAFSSKDSQSISRYANRLKFPDATLPLVPGYDERIPPTEVAVEDIDVLVVCSNDYCDTAKFPGQWVVRAKLLEELDARTDLETHLYGPEHFRDKYPRIYRGWLGFRDFPGMVARAKVTLNTHVQYQAEGYLNERVALIMGYRGLMICDPVQGIEQVLGTEGYLKFKSRNPRECVEEIRRAVEMDSGKRRDLREQSRKVASSRLSWDRWAESLSNFIGGWLEREPFRDRTNKYLNLDSPEMQLSEYHSEFRPQRPQYGPVGPEQTEHWTQFVEFSGALSKENTQYFLKTLKEVGKTCSAQDWLEKTCQ